jgi:PAS domain S-box-containing protein
VGKRETQLHTKPLSLALALGSVEEQHRLLMECVTDYAMFFLDPDGRVATWNTGAERIFGYPEAEIIGRHFGCFFTPEDIHHCLPEKELQTAAASGRANDDRWLVSKHGTRIWCNGVTTALRDGRLRGFAKVLRDSTERKKLEEALQHRVEDMAEEARRKDEFLATLAHELRNPLAPIRNALDIIRLQGDDAEVRVQVREMASRQVTHLARLVDDLLDLSRIRQGRIQLLKERIDVRQPVQRAVEGVEALMSERRLTFSVTLPATAIIVEADPTRLQQVVNNLLQNAARYTDPGGRITLTVERAGEQVELRVRDSGIGIGPEMLPYIFDLFVQAERRLDRSRGGLGIGLTLVRRLVELHGGSVTGHSDGPGQGSEFIVRLPALQAPTSSDAAPERDGVSQPPLIAPRHILVVDDNDDAAQSLALLLRLGGHEVRVANDGPSALAAVEAEQPEIVVLDLELPGMDGFKVARRLREQPGFEDMLVVALTGYGQEEDRQRCLEAGFDGHLVKPVEADALNQCLVHPKLQPKPPSEP